MSRVEAEISAKVVKSLISRVSTILRDGESHLSIIERFDELSKILFLRYASEPSVIETLEAIDPNSPDLGLALKKQYALLAKSELVTNYEPYSRLNLTAQGSAQIWQLFASISVGEIGSIAGLAYEEMLRRTFDKSENQQYFTPSELVEFCSRAVAPFLKGNVVDPACGTGGFLVELSKVTEGSQQIHGFEVDRRLAVVSEINLRLHGARNCHIEHFDGAGSLGASASKHFGKFDLILTNPPFGSDTNEPKVLNTFTLGIGRSSRRRGVLFIEQCERFLAPGGVLGLIIDDGVISGKSNEDVREYIHSHFEILAVVSLPETAFMPYASVQTSFLILRKRNGAHGRSEEAVIFSKICSIGRRPNGDPEIRYTDSGTLETTSDAGSVLKDLQGHFGENSSARTFESAHTFLAPPSQEWVAKDRFDYQYMHPATKAVESTVLRLGGKLVSLGDLCEDINEVYLPARSAEVTELPFTGLAQIPSFSGAIRQVTVPSSSVKSQVKRYISGDILFSRMRPALRKIGLVQGLEAGFASSECLVLRVRVRDGKQVIDPRLLEVMLKSDFVLNQLLHLVTGIGRPRLSKKDILSVKLPDLTEQQKRELQHWISEFDLVERNLNIRAKELQNELNANRESMATRLTSLIERDS